MRGGGSRRKNSVLEGVVVVHVLCCDTRSDAREEKEGFKTYLGYQTFKVAKMLGIGRGNSGRKRVIQLYAELWLKMLWPVSMLSVKMLTQESWLRRGKEAKHARTRNWHSGADAKL